MTLLVPPVAILLGAMTGIDAQDSATRLSKKRNSSNYTKFLDRDGLKGARIGVLRQAYERDSTDEEILKVFSAALDDLRRAGATLVAMTLPLTGDPEADRLLEDDPLALLIGMLLGVAIAGGRGKQHQ